MNENTIITGKKQTTYKNVMIVGGVLFALGTLLWILNVDGCRVYKYMHFGLIGNMFFFDPPILSILLDFGAILLVWGLIWYLEFQNVSITVTDKRVFGTAKWKKRVDLPFDSISAVATSALHGITVATSSGSIRFKFIENNIDVHDAISKLLLERQHNTVASISNIEEVSTASAADELKKYKDLLDSGIITEEEFNAKKKQLLGL